MNKEYRLRKPTLADKEQLIYYKESFRNPKAGIAGTSRLTHFEDISKWLVFLALSEKEETMPNPEFVPAILYVFVRESDNQIVGMSHLRLRLNEGLSRYGGHIGYSILPSEQRKGLGTLLLRVTLLKGQSKGIDSVFITCDDINRGSAKVIESNGGILENKEINQETGELIRRYWIQKK